MKSKKKDNTYKIEYKSRQITISCYSHFLKNLTYLDASHIEDGQIFSVITNFTYFLLGADFSVNTYFILTQLYAVGTAIIYILKKVETEA